MRLENTFFKSSCVSHDGERPVGSMCSRLEMSIVTMVSLYFWPALWLREWMYGHVVRCLVGKIFFYLCVSFLLWHNALLFQNIAPFRQIFTGHLVGMIGDLSFRVSCPQGLYFIEVSHQWDTGSENICFPIAFICLPSCTCGLAVILSISSIDSGSFLQQMLNVHQSWLCAGY